MLYRCVVLVLIPDVFIPTLRGRGRGPRRKIPTPDNNYYSLDPNDEHVLAALLNHLYSVMEEKPLVLVMVCMAL